MEQKGITAAYTHVVLQPSALQRDVDRNLMLSFESASSVASCVCVDQGSRHPRVNAIKPLSMNGAQQRGDLGWVAYMNTSTLTGLSIQAIPRGLE